MEEVRSSKCGIFVRRKTDMFFCKVLRLNGSRCIAILEYLIKKPLRVRRGMSSELVLEETECSHRRLATGNTKTRKHPCRYECWKERRSMS
jgi:hypothetical protein